jgi:uncharacterized protein YutE (UPF0331/DUF86 family)
MEKQFDVLTALKPHSLADFQTQPILRAAGERALHLMIECLTDIGNIIIDALIMRDPASYEDIFEILTEEGVFAKAFFEHFIPAVRYRKTLAHEYSKVQAEDVWNMVQAHADDFATMRDSIASYVKL